MFPAQRSSSTAGRTGTATSRGNGALAVEHRPRAVPSVVLADGRVVPVVSNSTYAHIGCLPNPDNEMRPDRHGPRRCQPRAQLSSACRQQGTNRHWRGRVKECESNRVRRRRACPPRRSSGRSPHPRGAMLPLGYRRARRGSVCEPGEQAPAQGPVRGFAPSRRQPEYAQGRRG